MKLKLALVLGWVLAAVAGAAWWLERRAPRDDAVDAQRGEAIQSFCDGKAAELRIVLRAFSSDRERAVSEARLYLRDRAHIDEAYRETLALCSRRPVAELPDLFACRALRRSVGGAPSTEGELDWDWTCFVERGTEIVRAIDPYRDRR